jgi:hypothetical protein
MVLMHYVTFIYIGPTADLSPLMAKLELPETVTNQLNH